MDYTQIILGIFSLVGILVGSYATWKIKTQDSIDVKHNKEVDNDIGLTKLNMQFMRDEIQSLKEQAKLDRQKQAQLEDQLQALKGGVLTLSLFGSESPLAMWAKDMKGRRTFHNKEYESMTGHMYIHCAGLTDMQITKNKELADSWGANDDHVLEKGVYFMTVEPCAHRDKPDDIFMVLVIKWPTRIQGQCLGTEGVAIRVDQIQEAFDKNQSV